jgi:hypothetical protein
MRRVTAILSVAVVLTAAGLAAQTRPSFAGAWKIDGDGGGGRSSGPGVDLTITQDAATMTVESRAGGLTPAPVKFSYRLDGSASKNLAARRGGAPTEQVSKATWAGNTLVVATTTGAGEERRTFSTDGDFLVVETSAPGRNGGAASVTKVTYKRYERGFGG